MAGATSDKPVLWCLARSRRSHEGNGPERLSVEGTTGSGEVAGGCVATLPFKVLVDTTSYAREGARCPRKTGFIETMDCLPVAKLPEGPGWTYEFLCCGSHKISYVAFGIMWRCCFSVSDKAHCLLRSAT